jgi:ribonuclease HI
MQPSEDISSLLDGRSSSGTNPMFESTHPPSDQLASLTTGGTSKKDTRKAQSSEDVTYAQSSDSEELSAGPPPLLSPTLNIGSSRTRKKKKLRAYSPYFRRERRKRELDELQPLLLLETEMDDGPPCSICEKRGTSEPCSQVGSSATNPKFSVKHYLDAAFFAAQVAKPDWMPSKPRMVIYTDGSVSGALENDTPVAGAGVTYKWISRDNPSRWTDASYGIVGTNCVELSELYAIGMALDIAAKELETTHRDAFKPERKNDTSSLRVMLMTDCQTALDYVHDYSWRGKIPKIISRDAFLRLMHPMIRMKELSIPFEFHWVPGHMDTEGNDRADSLAVVATRWTRSRLPSIAEETRSECHVVQITDPGQQAYTNISNQQRPKRKSNQDEDLNLRPIKRSSNLEVRNPEALLWNSPPEEEVRSNNSMKHEASAVAAERTQETQAQWMRSGGSTLKEL